jgi:hypothetical protein
MAKIAAVDNNAMNMLYAQEAHTAGVKLAAKEDLFADHKDYVSLLEETLKNDKKDSWAPNDMLLD